jgi:hypothetical protein
MMKASGTVAKYISTEKRKFKINKIMVAQASRPDSISWVETIKQSLQPIFFIQLAFLPSTLKVYY